MKKFTVVYRLPGKDAERWTVEAKDKGEAEEKTLVKFKGCALGIVKEQPSPLEPPPGATVKP